MGLFYFSPCSIANAVFSWGCMFFGPGQGTLFLDLYMFFGPGRFFLDLGAKNVGDVPVCFLDSVGIFFFGPACICAGPRDIFWDSQINCYWAWFLFFGPVRLLRGPCLHRVGGNSIVIGAHIGLDVFGPWRLLFLNSYMFFWTWHRVGVIWILRQDACKKLLMPGKFGYWNSRNVRGGGANGGSLRMKRNGCRKLRGTKGEGKVRYWNRMSATSCWEMRGEA